MEKDNTIHIKQGTTIRDYVFHQCIGSGGFASVYIVTSVRFGTKFVAKVILPKAADVLSAWDSFDSEVNSLVKLDHHHIIRLYDHFSESGYFFLILEFCSHGSLFEEVRDCGALKGLRLLNVTKQLISAVFQAHINKIAHRDIKPQNILFDDFGRVKLADFGISICSDINDVVQNFKCSPAFAPPEVLKREPHDMFKADVWSLGVTLYFAATGKLPFKFRTVPQALLEMRNIGLAITQNLVPPIIFELIKKMVVYDPNNRITIEEAHDMIMTDFQDKINKANSAVSKFPLLKLGPASPGPEDVIHFNSGVKNPNSFESAAIIKPNVIALKPLTFGIRVRTRQSCDLRKSTVSFPVFT
ncbi:CAMK family protein kinase [Tritrichomonas foetus]|uniref:CAMK family protein kinase n=1 Tax=Tritrichomonas foetus TaxID=1144522 RepID=A0A1J4JGB3_9EUKA|nr:CAMK family protein kinase [Tritrichomonas foetus]|eukprot:OHS96493.1 CAMK family protein kinase [Tritrichomonas foetus]